MLRSALYFPTVIIAVAVLSVGAGLVRFAKWIAGGNGRTAQMQLRGHVVDWRYLQRNRRKALLLAMRRGGVSTPIETIANKIGLRGGQLRSMLDSLELNGYVLPEGWPIHAYHLTSLGQLAASELRGETTNTSRAE